MFMHKCTTSLVRATQAPNSDKMAGQPYGTKYTYDVHFLSHVPIQLLMVGSPTLRAPGLV